MKKVHTPENVAHLWNNMLQEEARNSGNTFYYEGAIIYSYGNHFAIAAHVGNNTVMFTSRNYSNTTAKHKSIVFRAASDRDFIFCYNPKEAREGEHEGNISNFVNVLENIVRGLHTARKPEKYLNELNREGENVKKYFDFFGLELTDKLSALLSISNKEEFKKYEDNRQKLEEEERKKREKAERKKLAEELKKWRKGESRTIYGRIDRDFLRYNKESKRVETSQRVEIPEQIAKNTFLHIMEALKNGGCNSGNCGKVLEYTISEINKNFVKIGCHTIDIKEIKKIANLLNW